ncbi:MAG: DEAD/DEAH box helicase, partial [Oscillospiraceae bacterium]
MSETKFSELDILPEIRRAIDTLGFDTATNIQSQAIPMIKTGVDVIGRSQTGTGKTIAFGIPALEAIDVKDEKNSLQVMILCPTRELAQQACEEIKKLSQFMHGIKAVEVYGGVPMDRQIIRLKKANIVIGTPGRIMDHMRRKTLKVNNLKMIVLDEADEMLSMGFKEDIETILTDTPEDRQTVLFSATMPPSILAITKQFQKTPSIIEIDKKNVTLDNIEQFYIDAPMGRKMDALNLVLRFHQPKLAMIFANTKRMVDEITEYLCKNDFQAEGLHGDMKQSQRSKVMDSFKFGKTNILVATDVAARGIDVDDVDIVFNYDVPDNEEY